LQGLDPTRYRAGLSAPVVAVRFRDDLPPRLGWAWLPSSPSGLPSGGPAGLQPGGCFEPFTDSKTPLLRFDSTSAFSTLAHRSDLPAFVDFSRRRSTSRELFCPSACPGRSALLRDWVTPDVPETFALPPKSPALRVWLPSRRCQLDPPWEASFSSQRSWASPFKALLLPRGRIQAFPGLSPLRRSLRKPQGPATGAPAA
jgi:hypothetical protein